jgi:antitoxin YxxD
MIWWMKLRSNHTGSLFFKLGNDSLIFLDLSQETRAGIHPVDYAGIIIADSIEEFVRKLDARENCYLFIEI